MKVLLIGEVGEELIDQLIREKFSFTKADTLENALDLLKVYTFSAIVSEYTLPDSVGDDIVWAVKEVSNAPLMIYTWEADWKKKVSVLDSGAADFQTKQTPVIVIIARLYAFIRRAAGYGTTEFQFKNLSLNLETKIVKINNKKIHLTGKEFQILSLLFLHKGKTVVIEDFMTYLYNGCDDPENKIISIFVLKIRRKLSAANNGEHYIKTIFGRGFTLGETV
jgi:two-component system cell cycle response regulator CtrA